MKKNSFTGLFAGLFVVMLAACASIKLPEYTPPSDSQLPYITEQQGLQVAFKPMSDRAEVKKYFGADLIDVGVLPVYVSVSNHGDSSTYIIDQRNFSLRDAAAAQGNGSVDDLEHENAAEGVTVASVVLISPLLMLAGAKMLSDKTIIEENLVRKRLPTDTLVPGGRTSGFVFFGLPEGGAANGDWLIRLNATDVVSKSVVLVQAPFRLSVN